jgi:type II secretory pathway component PulM
MSRSESVMSLRESVAAFWRSRSTRERAILGSAAFIAAAALLYALVWEPGMAARRTLSATLPRMRAQLEDMRLQQKDILALRKQLESAPPRADLKGLLQDSAKRASFGRAVERVEAVGADRVFFAAGPVDFDAWLDWAAGLQRDFGARIDASKIVATEHAGLVRVEASFVARNASPARVAP